MWYTKILILIHVVYLKDSNNCQRTYNITITEPQTVTFTETHIDPRCWDDSDGSIVVLRGGDGDYTYSFDGNSYQTSNTYSNLSTGSYSVRVRRQ